MGLPLKRPDLSAGLNRNDVTTIVGQMQVLGERHIDFGQTLTLGKALTGDDVHRALGQA